MEFTTDLWAAFSNNPTPRTLLGTATGAGKGLTPTLGKGPDQEDLDTGTQPHRLSLTPQFPSPKGEGFGAGLIPLHSPLLGESWLVSFPPLSDMLKFSG